MKAVEALETEHALINRALDVLEAYAGRLERGQPVTRSELETVMGFLVDYADGVHHAKEEEIVLPLLCELDAEKGGWLSSALESDHKAGRKLVETMRRNLDGAARGIGHQAGAFADAGRLYARHLRGHISLEEDELYPAMRQLLTQHHERDVAQRFAEVDRAHSGSRELKHYVRLIADLETTVRSGPGRDGTTPP